MKKPIINIYKSTEELAGSFAELLCDKVNEVPNESFLTIALSGGSTPKAIFKYLAENYADRINWSKVKLFWGDERCVAPDDSESNYKMTTNCLLSKISIPAENVFRIYGEAKPAEEVIRYADVLRNNVVSIIGAPSFDIVLLGLGEDGHTASIFPNQIELFGSENLCEIGVHPQTAQQRITITGKVINNAKNIIFLATGKSKAEKVSEIIEHKTGEELFPASLVEAGVDALMWLIDADAAALLKEKQEDQLISDKLNGAAGNGLN